MYSCVFCCEFIDFVGVFFGCYCLTPVSLFIIRCKGSTEKQPVVRTLSTRRRFADRKPSTRGKLLSSLHRSKRVRAKYPHACCWKWTFPLAMSKMPSFSRRCESCDTVPGHGAFARRSNFPVRPRVAHLTKKTPQQTFPVDYEQCVSIFFWSVEQNARDTQMTTCVIEGAKRERLPPLFLASRGFTAQRSRARALPLLNLKKKRDCSQSTFPVVIRILSILKFFVCCHHSDIDFTKNCILTKFISKSIAGENSLNFIRFLRVVITPLVTCESTGR